MKKEMDLTEWDEVFHRLMAWFPNWRVDNGVCLCWYEELKYCTASSILTAVRRLTILQGSAWMPGIFEVVREIGRVQNNFCQVESAWLMVRRVASDGFGRESVLRLPVDVRNAARRTDVFSRLRDATMGSMGFIKTDFENSLNAIRSAIIFKDFFDDKKYIAQTQIQEPVHA